MKRATVLAPAIGLTTIAVVLVTASADDRVPLAIAALISVVAGLAATSIGVFGAILVPGLLLLGLEPRVAAPLSLMLQVLVIPLGAGTHAVVGNVRTSIAGPLVVGGITGSVAGALLASSVPAEVAARAVAGIIVVVGLILLANLGSRPIVEASLGGGRSPNARRVGLIGVVAGLASGVSGAGWGPIGVKLLIIADVEPRHAVGSSLVGRVAMAVAAIAAYGLAAATTGALRFDPAIFLVLLAGSAGSIVYGASLIGRFSQTRAATSIAIISIALALPTAFGWTV